MKDCCKKQYWACECGASPMHGGGNELSPPEKCKNPYCKKHKFRWVTSFICCERHHHHKGIRCPHCGLIG